GTGGGGDEIEGKAQVYLTPLISDDHHGVAVRVEAVSLGERNAIRLHRELVAGERRDEHEERGARKMKVGDEPVHAAKGIRRPNEEARLAAGRAKGTRIGNDRLKRPGRGRANGPDLSSALPYGVEAVSDRRAHVVPLLVHEVLIRVVMLHGLECAGADVLENLQSFDAVFLQPVEQL